MGIEKAAHVLVCPGRDDATVLSDMRGNYRSIYMRRRFSVDDPQQFRNLILEMAYDDGYENLHRCARPVLARHGYTATAYLVTGHIGGTNDQNISGFTKSRRDDIIDKFVGIFFII